MVAPAVGVFLGWLAKKAAGAAAGAGVKYSVGRIKTYYDNGEAFDALRQRLMEAAKKAPAECVQGTVTLQCPTVGMQVEHMYNPRAKGTDTWHIYHVRTLGGLMLQIQFYEITKQIMIFEYDASGKPTGKAMVVDPVEAMKVLKYETEATAQSPTIH